MVPFAIDLVTSARSIRGLPFVCARKRAGEYYSPLRPRSMPQFEFPYRCSIRQRCCATDNHAPSQPR
jgi:hypothetical protein